jgi:predicted RNA-binding Zn-ribbon protein involved in translation (DUF1610 family)
MSWESATLIHFSAWCEVGAAGTLNQIKLGEQGWSTYLYRTYTATVSGSRTWRVKCVGCSHVFQYEITRVVQGGGHSPFFLNNRVAAADAQERAKAKLQRALDEAVEPFYCPKCGIYQPDMVRVLRERYGKRCEPN